MKLKVFRGLLFASFFIIEVISIYFLVLSIINLTTMEKEFIMDGIMYVFSLVILIAFVGMEIYNTYYSIEAGSNFIRPLLYQKDELNKKCLYAMEGGSLLSLFGIIYFSLLYKGFELPLSDLDTPVIYIILCFLCMTFVNTFFVSIYPLIKDKDLR